MKKYLFLVFVAAWLLFLLSPKNVFAEDNKFINIVNPVRIAKYNNNPFASLSSEYKVIKAKKLPATWLITYDVLENKEMVNLLKSMDKNQEIGIFLEVTKNFSNKTGVIYNDTGFWHHANSVFLSGYTQEERKGLIDKVFETFKDKFGYYPVSVGSWWTDSYSLSYMKDKYNITGNLGCSDQFSTDGYKIWGQYWSTPYYPSKYHAGVPASDASVKLDLVTLQWAPRDPLNGYYNSLYSTQDYLMTKRNLDIEYLKKLVDLYAVSNQNQFGQITVGLESDLSPDTYNFEYSRQLDYVEELVNRGLIKAVTIKDFSSWYRSAFKKLTPPTTYKGTDFLGTGTKYVWFQNQNYRIFLTEDGGGIKTIRDLKLYNKDLVEPYYESPNREFDLAIYVPSLYDEINFETDVLTLPENTEVVFEENKIILKTEKIKEARNSTIKKKNGFYEINTFDENPISQEGVVLKGLSSEAIHFFKQKKFLLYLLKGQGWKYFKKVFYGVPQGELYALRYLSNQDKGIVVVVDKECLQCEYHTQYKHPAFSNLRNYVEKYGKHKIVYSSKIANTDNKEKVKAEIEKLNIKYIYLVKFEGYKEQIFLSPGDLNIEKIYESANAQIWRIK
jgi:hypothetical protein